ncbi:hypothetical protein PHLGIDRAFT_468009 [Phlebiopsis gigantea 11061_1 CR5-6]|uniref:Glucose receptor Git3 N-terminal domain-containing protein n=1 Tax=Phlebiopsis gigantea (strain 11061_1 CR5-6) TaxID=745531 RepID=A0A0C3S6H4_PHLG1|nr:hypothetical protein PHLGIDRAFT_468009 [Phlebiopsis gigantea 11061_1 CR5-6]
MLTLGPHKRITEEEIGSHGPTDLAVWLFFQIAAGHIALPILTATFILARTVTKIPALIIVCLTWILSAVFSTLLFYVGEHTGPEPGKGLCIAQASLLGATPLMTCSAVILLAIYVWKTYDDPDLGVDMQPRTRTGKLGKIALHCSPFFILGLFVAIGVTIALKHPERVTRTQEYFYCSLDWPPFTEAVSIISTLLCIVAMGIETLDSFFVPLHSPVSC